MSEPIVFHANDEQVDPAPVEAAPDVKPEPKKKATPKPANKAGYKPFNWL
jgi:hypothetical protein